MPSLAVLVEPHAAPAASSPAGPEPAARWAVRRAELRAWLARQDPGGVSAEEVEAHFEGMPARYWEDVTQDDLIWGLETMHRFLARVATSPTPPTMPVLDWRPQAGGGGTRVMLCTWDRHGLLAKAAACFSAAQFTIRQAEVFTRADHIVLDVFHVAQAGNGGDAASAERMEQMAFLLDGALSEPARFASVWACSRHKFLTPPPRLASRLTIDNDTVPTATVLRLEASDRLGLLYDVLQALAGAGLEVVQAIIQTEDGVARDVFHVTDAAGRQVQDPARLQDLRQAIQSALHLNP